ncbi:MAG: phage gp6-like head-tail connector protein, partial [Gammaproteobacteria bacterium]|nr:phage gp6-like head-tail connector protein [Gammaproteobacteria bacterium]MCP3850522.1 phage gp6-like head-tail connector protein [Gammaproteobacteria bacterium]
NQNYENVVITYQSGYTAIPEAINQAVLLLVGSMYDQRENHITAVSINTIPVSAEYLLNPYKVHAL